MMMFTADYLHECFAYDQTTGNLVWKARPSHHFVSDHAMAVTNSRQAGKVAGSDNGDGYTTIRLGKTRKAHHIVWAMHTGEWPKQPIDHRNGVRNDNRIENLRLATVGENNLNTAMKARNKCGIKGVYLTKYGTWRAEIVLRGRKWSLGTFPTAELAGEFYELAANMLHGEFARQTD